MRPSTYSCAAAALAAVILGCSRPAAVTQSAPTPAQAQQTDSAAVAKARADSVRYPYTQADVEFMSAMIGHHSQALQMAEWAPTHGARSSVRILAERIINGQQDEIGTMQRWLADRRKPVPQPGRMGGSGTSHHDGHSQMPGMLTPDQLRQLDQARGSEFDRLFLTFMIQHHRGAVSMVQKLFATPGAARDETVFKFANDVSVDQRTEVARMERMLAELAPEAGSQ
jgi:uncharacterized protein (DUF305 family)